MANSVECNVCMDEFSDNVGYVPRVLKCGHSFCEDCLGKLTPATEFIIECPTCAKTSTFSSSVKEFPKNFSLLELLDVLDKQEVGYCTEHPNYVTDMFCHAEEEIICLKCKVYGEHKLHEVTELSDFADKQRKILETFVVAIGDIINDCLKMKNELNDQMSELRGNYVLYTDMIETQFVEVQERIMAKICAAVNEKLEELLQDFEKMHAKQDKYLQHNENILTSQISELSKIKQELEDFLKETELDDEKIVKEKDLFEKAEKYLAKARQTELTCEHSFDVTIGEECVCQAVATAINNWQCEISESENCKNECFQKIHKENSESKGTTWKNINFQWAINFEKCLGQFFGSLS